jgi:hypothetical protein
MSASDPQQTWRRIEVDAGFRASTGKEASVSPRLLSELGCYLAARRDVVGLERPRLPRPIPKRSAAFRDHTLDIYKRGYGCQCFAGRSKRRQCSFRFRTDILAFRCNPVLTIFRDPAYDR